MATEKSSQGRSQLLEKKFGGNEQNEYEKQKSKRLHFSNFS